MFNNSTLKSHLESSSTIKTESLVLVEWNLNNAENIEKIGNYRYRPTVASPTEENFGVVRSQYDAVDNLNAYTNATNADIVVDGGYNDSGNKEYLVNTDIKMQSLFSLEQCFYKFRPRSGINKVINHSNRYLPQVSPNTFLRPRYYFADDDDNFKYWTSTREESVSNSATPKKRGVSVKSSSLYYIDDAAPFVKYRNPIFANRIVVKMQTHTSSTNEGTFKTSTVPLADPFYEGASGQNKRVPKKWKIQYLDSESKWITAYNFSGTTLVNSDGYVELSYGLTNKPAKFTYVQTVSSTDALPELSIEGYAYLVKVNSTSLGEFYIWNGGNSETKLDNYDVLVPSYGWSLLSSEDISSSSNYLENFTDPDYYLSSGSERVYREVQRLGGLRIVVETMNTNDSSFDLIELSPRLAANITDITESFNVKKTASDLGLSGLPVGQLIAGSGQINLFDYNQSFNPNNSYNYESATGSIVANLNSKNVQFRFFQIIKDVSGSDYYVPQKTLYSETFPEYNSKTRQMSITLRDLFFYLESQESSNIFITNGSLSYIVGSLLDSIGFSNFRFYRATGEKDFVVPYFFIAPKTTVAQVLQELARASQTAMFFDEYNNLIVMSKEYLMPDTVANNGRATNVTLYGTKDFRKSLADADTDGIINNESITPNNLTNIVDIASQTNDVYNDGKISYTTRDVAKAPISPLAKNLSDKEIKWGYLPTLLWEISADTLTKDRGSQSEYVLNAMPLNSDLSQVPPRYADGEVVNNVMDFGENIFWQSLNRYAGYFYANGEIIKYDAIQYDIPAVEDNDVPIGKVWITSQLEYEYYKSKLKFLGKMYATGLVRIYSEVRDSEVVRHGRGQFGTEVVYHSAKTARSSSYNPQTRVFVNDWVDKERVTGCKMNSAYLFEGLTPVTALTTEASGTTLPSGGLSKTLAQKKLPTTTIKNTFVTESKDEVNSERTQISTQAVSASALVMDGPDFGPNDGSPKDFIKYSYKNLGTKYNHVGTRMRIIGTIKSKESGSQLAYGSMPYFTLTGQSSELPTISGGSAGLGIMVNPTTNTGYYLELVALSQDNVADYAANNVATVYFYKLNKGIATTDATPTVLFRGLYSVLTDSGDFYGAGTLPNDEEETRVYDVAVEYESPTGAGKSCYFYIYINGKLIAKVEEPDFLEGTDTQNIALFVRGTSRAMFENVYALNANYSKNRSKALVRGKGGTSSLASETLGIKKVSQSGRRIEYGIPDILQTTFFSNIGTRGSDYGVYYEEFGTIMRECAYLNVKFDKAYPSLRSKVVSNSDKTNGYTISGFNSSPYGAEFLIFNNTDRPLSIGSGTGNPLSIVGLTLTNDTQNELTVDDYFSKRGDLSDTEFIADSLFNNPLLARDAYIDIKNSRMTYGKKDFNLDSIYIQTQDAANNIMSWIVKKIMKPRRSLGVEVFGMPILQLGDIVELEYDVDGINQISAGDTRFVVYSIENNVDSSGPTMNVYLSEVV
jgi:hypothetical protein